MKAVLASLKPFWYYLVGEGIKTIEVRKTFPKAEDWSRETYFYMSRDEKSFAEIPKEFQDKYRKHFGKVGLRFVCDRIDQIGKRGCDNNFDYCYLPLNVFGNDDIEIEITDIKRSCISKDELNAYGENAPRLYAWHISNLIIYDKPMELGEFFAHCSSDKGYVNIDCDGCAYYQAISVYTGWCVSGGYKPITRPPQSYMYCEDVSDG